MATEVVVEVRGESNAAGSKDRTLKPLGVVVPRDARVSPGSSSRREVTTEMEQHDQLPPPAVVLVYGDECTVMRERESSRGVETMVKKDEGESDSGTTTQGSNEVTLPIAMLALSFIFPLFGCGVFWFSLSFSEKSSRYRWAVRAMYTGAALSFFYTLLIACILGSGIFQGTRGSTAELQVGW